MSSVTYFSNEILARVSLQSILHIKFSVILVIKKLLNIQRNNIHSAGIPCLLVICSVHQLYSLTVSPLPISPWRSILLAPLGCSEMCVSLSGCSWDQPSQWGYLKPFGKFGKIAEAPVCVCQPRLQRAIMFCGQGQRAWFMTTYWSYWASQWLRIVDPHHWALPAAWWIRGKISQSIFNRWCGAHCCP